MYDKLIDCNSIALGLREILLGYLQAAQVSAWPGGDGLTVEDVVACYPEAVARGEVPDRQQLLRQHPELDAELHAWLADENRWEFAFRCDPRGKPHSRGPSKSQR